MKEWSSIRKSVVDALSKSMDDESGQVAAIACFIRDAYSANMVGEEIIDAFCVSTPNIVEDAGYFNDRGDAVVAIFDKLHRQIFEELFP